MNSKASYFVSKQHDMAKPMMQLLTDRLSDTGWCRTSVTQTSMQKYLFSLDSSAGLVEAESDPTATVTLSRTLDVWMSKASEISYSIDGSSVALSTYLEVEAQLTDAVYVGSCTVAESKWRLMGTSEVVSLISTESGVFVLATCSRETHDMLSEYYAQSKDPGTLWSGTDTEGLFWAMWSADGSAPEQEGEDCD